MVYSHDAFGLGNLSRMLAICDYLLSCWPRLSILLISGSPMVHGFRLPMGLDYIKLPCLNRGLSGKLSAKYLGTTTKETVDLRSQVILSAAAHFKPDLLLVDKKPGGLQGELTPTLTYLRKHHPKNKRVLLLRDILDAPQKTIDEWQTHSYESNIRDHYDQILIVGMQAVFDMVKTYQLSLPIAHKIRYCGYIRKSPVPPNPSNLALVHKPSAIKQHLGMTVTEPLILVTPGGGEDGYHLVKTYLDGLKQLSTEALLNRSHALHSLILCGPEMPATQKETLKKMARNLPRVTLSGFTNELMNHLAAADAIVSMGGYNTLTEILTLNKHPVVVPRMEPSQEQYIRATRFAQRGLVSFLHPQKVTPRSLIQTVLKQIVSSPSSAHPSPSVSLDFNGLPQLASHLSALVRPTKRKMSALCLLA